MSRINSNSAHDLLSLLVAALNDNSKYYGQYRKLYNAGNNPLDRSRGMFVVRDLLFDCMQKEIFDLFSGNQVPKHGAIIATSNSQNLEVRGVYLHLIEGLDSKWRFYVGQSVNLSHRIRKQHSNFRYRRDNPALHQFAMERSKWDSFVVLAVLPLPLPGFTPDEQGLLLNVLEMRCALLFETLQPRSLALWYPRARLAEAPWFGLNLALPLEAHDYRGRFRRWAQALKGSRDLVARAYSAELAANLWGAGGVVGGRMVGVSRGRGLGSGLDLLWGCCLELLLLWLS